MVLHMDPVAHIHAIAIDRQRLIPHRVDDHERDQFFRELIRAVIVRAARDDHFLPKGSVASEREQVGAGFARGIGRTRIERRLLGEFPGRAERAINFIGRDLNETLDAMAPRAIEQNARSDDVGVNEVLRVD